MSVRPSKKLARISKRKTLIILAGIALIGFGVSGFWQKYQATHRPEPEIASEIIPVEPVTHSTSEPDETPPKKPCEDYQVPAEHPREIELPSLGKSGCIQQVGIDQDNKIAVPTNIHVAGWFTGGAKPGEPGVSIIDGHVGGRYGDAIFTNLSKLNKGDTFTVEYGDGRKKVFEVLTTSLYSIDETARQQFKQVEGVNNQLTLITCGGSYDRAAQTYDKRTVVRARQLE